MINQEQLVEIHVLHQQGRSIRRIAKDLGISRNTVRTYLRDKSKAPVYPERQSRPTKLQPYHDYLRTRIEAAKPYWIPATVLLRELKSLGYEGGITMLKEHIRQYKPSTPIDPVVRFETLPGEQMQVDFTTITHYGVRVKAFVATLGYSRATFVRFSERERQEDWIQGLEEAFEYFGGVPKEVLFDNAKAIMIERDAYGEGEHRWNPALLTAAKKYSFKPRACRPYRAKTKGKVERFNSYLKNSFVTPLAATLKQHGLKITVDVLNGHIGAWLETVAHQRTHRTTGAKPQVLLDEERFILQLLPSPTRPVTTLTMSDNVVPLESFQHPLSMYDALLEVRP
ncbi:IS21 family transposase [Vibrio alginolyticus]|uniref:IS21 family transposase n=1 Tax=Vibrio alginolyticus TaxID=663 RepID=UPI001BD3AF25|nr:IS21 family transposase [Vibrio alginolyticus]MBS9926383.1 IS21 family transposase [Vibrio alginolyticus]